MDGQLLLSMMVTRKKLVLWHEWGNDTLCVCVYNTDGHSDYTVHDGPQWLAAAVYRNLVDGFDRVVVHFGGEGVGMTMAVDEIRLGKSWADVSSPITAVEGKENERPAKYVLSQNYPNPFNTETKITYSLPVEEFVMIKVYDLLGREVATLVNKKETAGTHEYNLNASGFSSGTYIYKMQAGNFNATRKFILLK